MRMIPEILEKLSIGNTKILVSEVQLEELL